MKRVITLCLLLFGMMAQAKTGDPVEKKTTRHCHYKAEYYAIRAQLEDGDITVKEAQRKWKKALKQLKEEEGK